MSLTLSAEPLTAQITEPDADFSANTLQVLHRVLIRLCTLAYEETEPKVIGRMLDDIEYFGILAIRSRTDNSPVTVRSKSLISVCICKASKPNITVSAV